MEEWNTASRLLDIALSTPKPIDQSQLSLWQGTVDEARKRQEEIKQRIDVLVRDIMSARTRPSDGLVIGQIDAGIPLAADGAVHQVLNKRS